MIQVTAIRQGGWKPNIEGGTFLVNREVKGVVGVATTNSEKLGVFELLLGKLGITGISLEQIPIYGGVEEPVDIDQRVVGLGKMKNIAGAIEASAAWQERQYFPDWLLIMDVLARADLGKGKEIVMKKPEKGEVAIDVFTSFFAQCLDSMTDDKNENDLKLVYSMIHALAPVEGNVGKIDVENIRVEWDSIDFHLSRALVKILADPDQLREYARLGIFDLEKVLGNDTVVGFRIQTLLPEIPKLAAAVGKKEMEMSVVYGRGKSSCHIDSCCELVSEKNNVETTVTMSGIAKARAAFLDFTYWAVKNVTPWLLKKMLTKKN